MRQLASAVAALDPRRRLVAALAALALLAVLAWLVAAAGSPRLALLYAGLDPAAAGEVVTALDRRGVVHEVRGDALWVDAGQRDELRLMLAAEGLPASGGAGYELLDGLTGFGTTAQMFDAAYWRAKEGELARTIAASPQVRAARVHLARPPDQPFARAVRPTASVTVTPARGPLSAAQARALRHLVAASVAGLAPADVTVIDGASGLSLVADDADGAGPAGDRAEALRENVLRLVEARVGRGRAVVEVAVEAVAESESIVERRVDPAGRAAVSEDSEERTTTSSAAEAGGVSVASNLPEGDAAAGGGSRSQTAEARSRTAFEVSETRREVTRAAGGIRRITVAVLVDALPPAAGAPEGTAGRPRDEEELAALGELVASAVGFDAARGDVITIRSLPFEPAPAAGSTAAAGVLDGLDATALAQVGVLAVVALLLGLFVLRPILAGGGARGAGLRGLPAPEAARGLPALAGAGSGVAVAGGPVLTGEIDDGALPVGLAAAAVGPAGAATAAAASAAAAAAGEGGKAGSGDGAAPGETDPVARLRRLIAERQTETVEILRGWMEEREEQG